MKQTIQRLTIMAALLIAVLLTASAQNGISAKLQNDGHTLKFSATGFTVTKEGKPKIDKRGYGHDITLNIEGTIEAGTTIKAVLERVSGKGKNDPSIFIHFDYMKKGQTMWANTHFFTRERTPQMTKSFKVTDDMSHVAINYIYVIPDPAPNSQKLNGTVEVKITLDVVEKPQPLPPLAIECDVTRVRGNNALHEYETLKYKDCGIRFRDITGDVSWRPCDWDDDQWESAEFDTILHYLDLIKTEVDSEAILGLADKTSFIIGEKTILQLPAWEGEVSNIKMIAGVIWVNMKKIVFNGGELRLDGTQACAGIRGTVVAMKETGRETSFWLFAGKVDVTSRKTGRKITLKPGQMAVTGTNGETQVKKFDIAQGAKKFKIPMSEIENHYAGQEFTVGRLTYRILKGNNVEVKGIKKGETCKQIQILDHAEYNGTTYKVVAIAKQAFANQTQLTDVSIPKTIRGIAEDAFLNTGLTQVVIPGDQVSIVKNAFRNCLKLATVTISGNEPACSPDAFIGCSAMKELRIKGISESNNGKKLNGTNAVIKVIK